jgi:hypothetical protein
VADHCFFFGEVGEVLPLDFKALELKLLEFSEYKVFDETSEGNSCPLALTK